MSNISPKVIDVEGNRIGTEVFVTIGTNISGKIGDDQFNRIGYERKYEGQYKRNIGRFPTQLFTNLIDEKYKYIKRI